MPATASAVAPDPGGDPNAQISLPPPGKDFGFNGPFNPGAVSVGGIASNTAADLIHHAGGNAERTTMSWWGLEPLPDQWNTALWSTYQTMYSNMLAQGITPHLILMNAPPWARDPGAPQSCLDRNLCHYPPSRLMLGQWKQFVAEVARRFPRATLEIWNEENFLNNWQTGVDPARYAELLAAAYDAAKAVNPAVQVMMGGLGTSAKANSLTMRQFLDGAYAASPSLKGHTNAVNLHVYPSPNLGAGSTYAQAFQDARDIRAKYADQLTPLYVSETGYTTSGPNAVSEADQADLILRVVRKTLTIPDVSGVQIHTLVDQSQYATSDYEYGYGLLRYATTPPFPPKRAFCQLTRVAGDLYSPCPPLAIIDSGPSGLTNDPTPTFSFSATESGGTFECSLDGAPFKACTSPVQLDGLADGQHSFRVRALGPTGNFDPTPIERDFTLDTQAPLATIDSGPEGPTTQTTPTFHFVSDDSTATFECSLDGAPFGPCTGAASERVSSPLPDGVHTFEVRATDPAGNVGPVDERDFTVDTIPPAAPQVSAPGAGPGGYVNSRQVQFSISASEPGLTYRCNLDGGGLAPCGSAPSYANLTDGAHTLYARAVDAAGNVSPPGSARVVVDVTAPTTRIVGPSGPTNQASPSFSFSATESGATFECSFDGGPFQACASPVQLQGLAEGAHSFDVRARDQAGNTGPANERDFTVDTTPPASPQLSIPGAGPGGAVNSRRVRFSITDSEAGVKYRCNLDGGGLTPCGSAPIYGDLTEGAHTLYARAVDAAGNVSQPVSARVIVDLTPPDTSINGSIRITRSSTARRFRLTFSSTEPGGTFRCKIDHRRYRPCSSPYRSRRLKPGRHTLKVRAVDPAGNVDPTPAVVHLRVKHRRR